MSGLAGRRALAAFGRNDIRGTYRDPLLVMIVVAPIIWTLGVVILTPLFTEMLAERYEFDLVPYYPLVLTAFLLLTSIVIAGGLGAFLVLDEVDADTLTALRVTGPRPAGGPPIASASRIPERVSMSSASGSPAAVANAFSTLTSRSRSAAGILRNTRSMATRRCRVTPSPPAPPPRQPGWWCRG